MIVPSRVWRLQDVEEQLATNGNELADVKKELQAVQKVTAIVTTAACCSGLVMIAALQFNMYVQRLCLPVVYISDVCAGG